MKCIKCDFELPGEVKFCPVCGTRQAPAIPTPAPTAPPPPQFGAPPQGAVPPPQGNIPPRQGIVPPPQANIPPRQGAAPPPNGNVPPPPGYVPAPQGYPPPPPGSMGIPPYEEVHDSPKYVGFGGAIALYFKNYINFRTRSTRSEYWYAYLFTSLIRICCWLVDMVMPVKVCSLLATVTFFIPSLSIAYRRFHDTGRTGNLPLIKLIVSGLWSVLATACGLMFVIALFSFDSSDYERNLGISFLAVIIAFLLGLIPLSLNIWQIVICCLPGDPKPNEYGREPRY